MTIHLESPADIAAVRHVEAASFPTEAEADLVDDLRACGESAYSLVAMEAGAVVGHVLFSVLRAPFRALALAPLAVLPDWRRRGVAASLVRHGLALAEADGWRGVFVLGDPAYYGRFGFLAEAAAGFESPYVGAHFMAMALGGSDLPSSCGPIGHAAPFAKLD